MDRKKKRSVKAKTGKIIEMGVEEFVRRLKSSMKDSENRFTFFLGSGCSVSSGIPAAGALVQTWLPRLKELKTGSDDGLEDWVKKEFPGYDDSKAAEYYGDVIEKLFLTSEERQKEIERITEGKDPGFGYAVLSQLMSHKECGRHFNVVLTTNFDDMVADALYLYTNKKPLLISHDSLVGFVRISRTRPLVIKLHGDARLAPKSTEVETKELDEEVKKVLKNLLSETGLVFIGYNGNDKSIVNILKELPGDALPLGVYWVGDKMPESEMAKWLGTRSGIWVRHRDFDELMLLLWNEFDLEHPKKERFDELLNIYFETFKALGGKVKSKPDTAEKRIFEKAVEKASREFKSWWSVEFEAEEHKKKNPEKADKIYQKGIKEFPKSSNLLGSYAIFLKDVRKDHEAAEKYYKKALEADPNHANNLGNYAGLLLAQGNREGFKPLKKAMKLAEKEDLKLECLFYQYAHNRKKSTRNKSLVDIKKLIKSGFRSPGWNLEENVKRAVKDGHPHLELLDRLSKVIVDEIDAKELDEFDIWKD